MTVFLLQGNIQLTKRNNFFDEKENSQEKNYKQQSVAASSNQTFKEKMALRPALRTIALEKQAQQIKNIPQVKFFLGYCY